MTFNQLVQKRESCRNFSDRPVEKEKLISIIETVRLAPSACNSQPWHFTLATGESARKISACTHELNMNSFTESCPAFIVINEEPVKLMARISGSLKSQHYAQIDIGIAAAHICYAATDLDLSTCILGWFNENQVAQAIGISPDKRIRLIIAVGYAASDTLREKKRKDISNILTVIE